MGHETFSENVSNRFDDGDASRLDRYMLIIAEDTECDDYSIWTFASLRLLRRVTAGQFSMGAPQYAAAWDLDSRRRFSLNVKTTVKLTLRK